MHEVLSWGAVVGTWLLVVGPVYQAVLELSAEQIELDRLRALDASLPAAPPISAWWWLLPPVRLALSRRRAAHRATDALVALTEADRAAITSYANKAVGWMFVAGGALLLALEETYQLTDAHHWPQIAFWLLDLAAVVAGWSAIRGLHHRRQVTRVPSARP